MGFLDVESNAMTTLYTLIGESRLRPDITKNDYFYIKTYPE